MDLADLKKNYSKEDLKFTRNDQKFDLMKKFYDIHGHEPHESFLYAFLCLIYDGHNSLDLIKKNLRLIFISSTKQAVIEDEDIEEYYQQAKRKGLISINENKITLTKTGKELVETSYFWNLHTSHWMGIFFSKYTVMIATAIFLIILAILKIITGLQVGSEGMLNEGFENLTDLIKIGIILVFSIKLSKDKIASIIIISLMLYTGFTLAWSSVEALFHPHVLVPTVQAFVITILSMIFNAGLMLLKGIVGRNSGNLSILSDSKDSELNIKISAGVMVGLIFAIFNIYFMDDIVGLIIAFLIFKEGIEIIREIIAKEEDFDIRAIKVFADHIYDDRLTSYLLGSIRRETISRKELIENFEHGLKLGRLYYEGFADFFYRELGRDIAEKHLDALIRGNLIKEENGELYPSEKGMRLFYKVKAKEYLVRMRNLKSTRRLNRNQLLYCILFILFILVIIFAPQINSWFLNF
jgi:hypothetical protein